MAYENYRGKNGKSYFRKFLMDTLHDLWVLVRNPSYISVCACWLILAICGGVVAVVSTYTFIYAFEFTTEEIAIRGAIALPGAFLGIVFSRWLVSILDKKYTVIFTILLTAF